MAERQKRCGQGSLAEARIACCSWTSGHCCRQFLPVRCLRGSVSRYSYSCNRIDIGFRACRMHYIPYYFLKEDSVTPYLMEHGRPTNGEVQNFPCVNRAPHSVHFGWPRANSNVLTFLKAKAESRLISRLGKHLQLQSDIATR